MTFEEALWVGSGALRRMACPADTPACAVPSGFKPPAPPGALAVPGLSVPAAASTAEGNLMSGSTGFIYASCTGPGPTRVRDYGASCLLGNAVYCASCAFLHRLFTQK